MNIKEKQTIWDETYKKLNNKTDGLGKKIDSNIKDVVTSFNVNGIPTLQSCEGHIEIRGDKLMKLQPYIMFGNHQIYPRFENEDEIRNKILKQFCIPGIDEKRNFMGNKDADNTFWKYIMEQSIPETKEFIIHRKENEKLLQLVQNLLDIFYKNEINKDNHQKLYLKIIGPNKLGYLWFGKDNPLSITKEKKSQYEIELKAQQEEIHRFGIFLKDKFFDKNQ